MKVNITELSYWHLHELHKDLIERIVDLESEYTLCWKNLDGDEAMTVLRLIQGYKVLYDIVRYWLERTPNE